MKMLRAFPLGEAGCILGIVNALLAVGLTVAALGYVRPKDCNRTCGELEGTACPSGACRIGEQRAGWPLPVFIDSPGGGSPTGGWGILGPEDPPLPQGVVLDVLFYSVLLWAALYMLQAARGYPTRPSGAPSPNATEIILAVDGRLRIWGGLKVCCARACKESEAWSAT